MAQNREQLKRVQNYLNVPKNREKLRQQLQDKQEHLIISIKEAAIIVGTNEAKIRGWDKYGLLPLRNKNSPRHYSVHDIAKLLIIKKLLDEKFTRDEVTSFMQQDTQFVDDLVRDIIPVQTYHEYPRDVMERLNWEEDAFFWRIFVPRSLYLSMRLLFGRAPSHEIWLLLPLSIANTQTKGSRIQNVEQLSEPGEILLGYCSDEHPFFVCITNRSILDLPKEYREMPPEWPESSHGPVGVRLLIKERSTKYWGKSSENALSVAGRLLRSIQETQSQWRPHLQKGNDFMLYDAPEFKKAALDNNTLSKIANQIVQLGGMSNASQQLRWRFCCILLLPDEDTHLPVKRRHLRVWGQSNESPYKIDETELSSNESSISMRAYYSGQIIYRSDIVDEELDIASHEQEKDIKSAIAIPIEGRTSQSLGVLYVASREVDAFSKKDDLLLLRIMGRIIAEQLIIYQTRRQLVHELPKMIADPQIVDSPFDEFLSENDFRRQLGQYLKQIKPKQHTEVYSDSESQPFHDLVCIAVDLATPGSGSDRTTERAIRGLAKDVGKRIKSWLRAKPEWTQYYMHDECYSLLLKDVSLEKAVKDAHNLQGMLLNYIQKKTLDYGFPESVGFSDIRLHIGVVGYNYDMLQDLLAKTASGAAMSVNIVSLLNDALKNCENIGGSNIVIWQPQAGKFDHYKDKLTGAENLQPLDESFIKQVADKVYELLKNDERLQSPRKKRQ